MNILITGSAGFVGYKLYKSLRKSHEVVGVDNRFNSDISDTSIKNISTSSKEFLSILENNNFDLIIHLAAQASGEVSFEKPEYDIDTNYKSTAFILESIKTKNTKLIFASSMSVYGDCDNIAFETDQTNPKSIYALNKLNSEKLITIYSKIYGVDAVSLRLFNIFGPGQNLENLKQGMVSIFLQQSLLSDKILVKGSLERYRDQIYIDDVIDAFMQLVMHPEKIKNHEIFNICTGVGTSVKDIINIIKEENNREYLIEVLPGTPGDQVGMIGSYKKFNDRFDWTPKFTFKTGLKEMIKWAKNG